MSHSVVEVEGTDWVEPVLVWVAICMQTGSGKSSLCKLLTKFVEDTRVNIACEGYPTWLADDQTLEKLGVLMSENNGKLLGLYDELLMFFSQMNIFHGKNITDSRELSVFLQLFGGKSWSRKTGKNAHITVAH
jgi:ABC-type Na+ transport system ATPase subunit NatA